MLIPVRDNEGLKGIPKIKLDDKKFIGVINESLLHSLDQLTKEVTHSREKITSSTSSWHTIGAYATWEELLDESSPHALTGYGVALSSLEHTLREIQVETDSDALHEVLRWHQWDGCAFASMPAVS